MISPSLSLNQRLDLAVCACVCVWASCLHACVHVNYRVYPITTEKTFKVELLLRTQVI